MMYNKCILNTQQARANRDAANRRSVGGSTLGVARQNETIDSVTKRWQKTGKGARHLLRCKRHRISSNRISVNCQDKSEKG